MSEIPPKPIHADIIRESDYQVLHTAEQIQARLKELGAEISRDYAGLGGEIIVVAMLKGSTYFLADLTRYINLPLTFDFIAIAKFTETAGETGMIRLTKDLDLDIAGKHVLVVEEIVRTGITTNFMIQHLEEYHPASLTLAALIANPQQLLIDLPLKYIAFEIDYTRVIGYGMDYKEKGRNLPFIAVLDRDNLVW